jgi:hypothetical protein
MGSDADAGIMNDVVLAIRRARTELAEARVWRDAFFANTSDKDLEQIALELGRWIDDMRRERVEARARLVAAAHTPSPVKND